MVAPATNCYRCVNISAQIKCTSKWTRLMSIRSRFSEKLSANEKLYCFVVVSRLWKSCESSVGGDLSCSKFSLAAQRIVSENPASR